MPVHDIQMQQIRTRVEHAGGVVTEFGEVGREDGRGHERKLRRFEQDASHGRESPGDDGGGHQPPRDWSRIFWYDSSVRW